MDAVEFHHLQINVTWCRLKINNPCSLESHYTSDELIQFDLSLNVDTSTAEGRNIKGIKVKLSHYRTGEDLRAPRISRQSQREADIPGTNL